jgi:cysteine desulfurase/selenocysteine lyase
MMDTLNLPQRIRQDFPILQRKVHGKDLVYLDNAASAQKPLAVIEGQREYLSNYHSNIHRGAHHLAQLATEAFEGGRQKIADHIGAQGSEEIIFTGGSTDAINLVAQAWGRANLTSKDTVLVTQMEHHANIVPWQMVCEERGAKVVPVKVREDGTLDLDHFAT